MALPWETLASVPTAEGPLTLLRRGAKDFLILIDGRVLMSSITTAERQASLIALVDGSEYEIRALLRPCLYVPHQGCRYSITGPHVLFPANSLALPAPRDGNDLDPRRHDDALLGDRDRGSFMSNNANEGARAIEDEQRTWIIDGCARLERPREQTFLNVLLDFELPSRGIGTAEP